MVKPTVIARVTIVKIGRPNAADREKLNEDAANDRERKERELLKEI
jgi:hypothetical protein